MKKIYQLVLPIAGMGKRLRPLTLRIPKNLIKVNGKPILEYALEEGVVAGIRQAIFIVSPQHIKAFKEYLVGAKKKFPHIDFHIRVQDRPLGNGHAILQAADLLKQSPFAVRFPDDIIISSKPVLGELVSLYSVFKSPIMLLRRIPKREVSRYGVVKVHGRPRHTRGGRVYRVKDLVEKPSIKDAPSNLIIIGGYVLTPKTISVLRKLERNMPQVDDGLHLVHAFEVEVESEKFYGLEFKGVRLDCGTLDGLKDAEDYFRGAEISIADKFLK